MPIYMVELKQHEYRELVTADDAVEACGKALAEIHNTPPHVVRAFCITGGNRSTNRWRYCLDGEWEGRTVDLVPARHAKAAGDKPEEQVKLLEFLGQPKLFEE